MRSVLFGAILALVASVAPSEGAEPQVKWTATVNLKSVEIRSGPSWKFPQTGILSKGEQVAIHHEDDQWYAILPPRGSVSWVNHRFLGKFNPEFQGKQNAVIMKDDYAVHVGSEIEVRSEGKEPSLITDIRQVKLPYGQIVEIIGPKKTVNESTWYPITPPPGEYRYIAKAALRDLQPVQLPSASAKASPSGIVPSASETLIPTGIGNGSPSLNPTSTAKVNHPLWGEAELLQSQGRFNEAEKVYYQIYQELKTKRAELEELLTCLNRMDECKQKSKSPNSGFTGSRNGNLSPAAIESPMIRPATSGREPPPQPSRRDWPTSRIDEQSSEPTKENDANLKATGPGVLRRTPFFIDNKQSYALERPEGGVIYYVTAQSGLNLDTALNKRVELLGTVQVRGDVRGAPYMSVSKINPATK